MKRKIIGGIIIGCFVLLVVGIPLLSKIIYPDNMSNKNCSNSEEVQAYKMAQKKRILHHFVNAATLKNWILPTAKFMMPKIF